MPSTHFFSFGSTGGGGGLPSGAALLMYSEDGLPAGPIVRNRAVSGSLPANLLINARPMTIPYVGTLINSMTRTSAIAGTDGALLAVRGQYVSGSSPFMRIATRRLAAGTYTMQADMRSNTGADIVVRLGTFGGGTLQSGNITVTSTWATYSHTFTIASETTVHIDVTPGTLNPAIIVDVDNVALVTGPSPIVVDQSLNKHVATYDLLAGVRMSGNAVLSEQATVSGARMTLTAADQAQSALSFVAAVWMDPAFPETGTSITALVVEVESASNELNSANGGLIFGNSSGMLRLEGTAGSTSTLYAGAHKAGWCILTAVGDATGTKLWINKLKAKEQATAYVGGTFSRIDILSMRRTGTFQFPGKMAFLGMWQRKLSDAEVSSAQDAAIAQITAIGETYTDFGTAMVAEGDSITAGTGDPTFGGYASRSSRLHTTRLQTINYAVASATLSPSPAPGANDIGAANRLAARDAKISEIAALGKRAILSVLIGANSVPNNSGEAISLYGRLLAYTNSAKALGAKIVVQTMTDNNTWTAGQRTAVQEYNQLIRDGLTSGDFDAMADHELTAMWPWSGTYYGDLVHPNVAGHTLMAATHQAAVAPLII